MTTHKQLEGRRFLITGAARGIGRAIAELFASNGASLALCDIEAEGLRTLAHSLGCASYPADIANEDEVNAMVNSAAKDLQGIDGVLNAAGILRGGDVETFDSAQFTKVLQVNLLGPFHVCRAAVRFLRAASNPTIVNIASISALSPSPLHMGYCASKAGLLAMTRNLAVDLSPHIRANAICPGIIKTEMTRELWEDEAASQASSSLSALKRLGSPDEIAQLALFLSTDASSYTNGAAITADGGLSWH